MKKRFFVGLVLSFFAFSVQAAVVEDFNGTYTSGLCDGWTEVLGGWGDATRESNQQTPGLGGAGSAQQLRSLSGELFAYRVFSVNADTNYDLSMWVRTYRYDGTAAAPEGWVEFGYNGSGSTNVDLASFTNDVKNDYANNVGTWVQYTISDIPVGPAGQITVWLKIGATASPGTQAHFDDVDLTESSGEIVSYDFPDPFDGPYSAGKPEGWQTEQLPGGTSVVWQEQSPGRGGVGSAWDINGNNSTKLGGSKLFNVEQGTDAQLSLWINGAQRDGDPIQAMALIRFGYDLTGQQDDPAAGTIVWTSDPTGYFTNAANANTWARFTSGTFTPTSDTISVWLWVEGGDSPDGVRAYFDDLSLITEDVPPPASVQETWEVYR